MLEKGDNKMPSITIDIGEEEKKILTKRAKKNLLTLRELIEDILRRSAISTKAKSKFPSSLKIDDKLVGIFSRERRGRKKKKSKKKKK